MEKLSKRELKKRWDYKRDSIYNLRDNINRLKLQVRKDLKSKDEKNQLTALIVRIMMNTSERVGNESSAYNGRFGISQLKNEHIFLLYGKIHLIYVGKSGVSHSKSFSDKTAFTILKKLKKNNKNFLFITSDGFRIKPDRVNRYLNNFGAKSKDIRGYNANHLMISELKKYGKVNEEKDRKKIFNLSLKKVSSKIGHSAHTLRTHYLLPEIEENYYSRGSVGKIKI
jgi:DNA topoisomerase IB